MLCLKVKDHGVPPAGSFTIGSMHRPRRGSAADRYSFFTLHIGAFVDVFNRQGFSVHLYNWNGNNFVMWNSVTRYMLTPSELGLYNPEANSLPARPIPDHRAFAQYYNNI